MLHLHPYKDIVLLAYLWLVVSVIATDFCMWQKTGPSLNVINSFFKHFAAASPVLDSDRNAVATVNQDVSTNSRTIGADSNLERTNNVGFINFHLGTVGSVGIGILLLIGVAITAVICQGRCKSRWRRNAERRRREITGEETPNVDRRRPKGPTLFQALARRMSTPSQAAAIQMQMLDKLNRLELQQNQPGSSRQTRDQAPPMMEVNKMPRIEDNKRHQEQAEIAQDQVDQARGIHQEPAEQENTMTQDQLDHMRRINVTTQLGDKIKDIIIKYHQLGIPNKELVPRALADIREDLL